MKQIAITENHLYSKAYAKGQKYNGKNVVIYVLKDYKAQKLRKANPQKIFVNRVGNTVSKKIGGAVVRSRVKRILREGLRQVEQTYEVKKGFLIVLVAKGGAVDAKSTEIAVDLINGFTKLELI